MAIEVSDVGNRTTDRRHLHLVQWRDESKLRATNLYPNNYFNELTMFEWWDEAHINYYNRPFLYKKINS
jgi:hypothetical protein